MLWLKQNKRLKSKKQAINRKEEQEPPAGKRNSRFLLNFMDEILKYAIENGIINPAHVLEEIQMKKNEEILKKYKIWQGKNNNWYTYIYTEKNSRKLVKRSSRKGIEDYIIAFEKEKTEKPKTFMDVYEHWIEIQKEFVTDNTLYKYSTDRTRYFEKKEFTEKEIEKMTEEDIKVFIVRTVKDQKLCKKACKTLFGYIKNTIDSARSQHLLNYDPMEFLSPKIFYKYCTEIEKPSSHNTISDHELKLIINRCKKDFDEQPEYIPSYAVYFASLTGMRVGEISALKWEDINENYISINKSEKYNRNTKEYYIGKTKNQMNRWFPMTGEIRKLLMKLKSAEISNGYISEWLFSNENGRVHAPVISSCLKNKCRQEGMEERGIHAFRRTINSKLRCNGVSATVAASLLGHTEEVNEKYYTFDVSSLEEKNKIVSKVQRIG